MRHSFEDFDFMSLSTAERLLLAQELLDSVFDVVAERQFTTEQTAELNRRLDRIHAGEASLVPSDIAIARLMANR